MVADSAGIEPEHYVRELVERLAREEKLILEDVDDSVCRLRRGTGSVDITVDPRAATVAVRAKLVPAPTSAERRLGLFEELLRLNDVDAGEASFALREGVVTIAFVRTVHGLDYLELAEGIAAVFRGAEDYDELVREKAGATEASEGEEVNLAAYVTEE